MKKKIIKLAIIRTDDTTPCPFGLSIPFGCKNAGTLIENMAPIDILGDEPTEKEVNRLVAANRRLMRWKAPGERCSYAGKLFINKDAVECNWGSNAPGIHNDSLIRGAPFYSKVYNNVAYDGLYSMPIGFYGDLNISRNLYYGIYSLQGENISEIEKFAEYLNKLKYNFDDLNENDRKILVSFAVSHANKEEFNSRGSISPYVKKIANILNDLKDKNESC